MQLKELMSTNVELASPDMTVKEAATRMGDGDFGVLPVGENDRLVGMVTDRDIVVRCCAEGHDPNTAKVGDVMTDEVRWAFDDQTAEDAAALMKKHQIRRLPVINREKRLVGIVALGDFAIESSEIKPAAETLSEVSKAA